MHPERERLKDFVAENFKSVQDFADLFGFSHSNVYSKFYNRQRPFKSHEKQEIIEKISKYVFEKYGRDANEEEVFGTSGTIIKTNGNNNTIAGGNIDLSSIENEGLKERIKELESTISLQRELIAALKKQLAAYEVPPG